MLRPGSSKHWQRKFEHVRYFFLIGLLVNLGLNGAGWKIYTNECVHVRADHIVRIRQNPFFRAINLALDLAARRASFSSQVCFFTWVWLTVPP